MFDECELAESEAVAASVEPEPLPPKPVPVEKPPKEPKPPKPVKEPRPPPPPLPELPPMTESKLILSKRVRKEGRENEMSLWRQARGAELRKAGYGALDAKERSWHEASLQFAPIAVEKSKWTPPKVDVGDRLAKLPALKDVASRDEAVLWVLNHAAMVREEVGPSAKRYLESSDIDGCPNRAAWLMLHWAINDHARFQKDAFTLLGKMGGEKGGDQDDHPASGLGEMTEMLARLGDA